MRKCKIKEREVNFQFEKGINEILPIQSRLVVACNQVARLPLLLCLMEADVK